jgi:hypothetical protein
VPWKALSPQNARSELNTLEPVPLNGTLFSENPSAVMFGLIAQSFTTSTGGGMAPSGAAVSPTASAASARYARTFISPTPKLLT